MTCFAVSLDLPATLCKEVDALISSVLRELFSFFVASFIADLEASSSACFFEIRLTLFLGDFSAIGFLVLFAATGLSPATTPPVVASALGLLLLFFLGDLARVTITFLLSLAFCIAICSFTSSWSSSQVRNARIANPSTIFSSNLGTRIGFALIAASTCPQIVANVAATMNSTFASSTTG